MFFRGSDPDLVFFFSKVGSGSDFFFRRSDPDLGEIRPDPQPYFKVVSGSSFSNEKDLDP